MKAVASLIAIQILLLSEFIYASELDMTDD
jgi:hypothetical protein